MFRDSKSIDCSNSQTLWKQFCFLPRKQYAGLPILEPPCLWCSCLLLLFNTSNCKRDISKANFLFENVNFQHQRIPLNFLLSYVFLARAIKKKRTIFPLSIPKTKLKRKYKLKRPQVGLRQVASPADFYCYHYLAAQERMQFFFKHTQGTFNFNSALRKWACSVQPGALNFNKNK